jgi:hypothetical protein
MQPLRSPRCARRALVVLAVAAGLAGQASAALATSPPSTVSPPPAPTPGRTTASLTTCHVAADLLDRYATFAAQMVATPTTQQMALRLQLYEHTPGTTGYRLVTGVPGFGVWETSAAGIGIFNYSQEVTSLTAPASFRVQVGYRWLDGARHVIKRATRTTVACAQPAQLPDLVAGALSISPGGAPGTSTYTLAVRNDGSAPAVGGFEVGLSVDGVALAEQPVAGLSAGARTIVVFSGPSCRSGGSLQIVVDPEGMIQESTDADNTRTVACR